MPSTSDYSSRMRQTLSVTAPELDTSIGTPLRKIIDSVAESLAEISVDNWLLSYQYDIDMKFGADLDDFVALFGFRRLPARRASGSITFSRSTAATQNILIRQGTQVSTETAPRIVVETVVPGVLAEGETEVTVPAVAVSAGASGNAQASSLTLLLNDVQGITTVTNQSAFTGGTDRESDDALKKRFKRTIFRSMAGTVGMYEGVALEDENATQVNVIGASKRYREQLEISSGTAASTITNDKYVYPASSVFGADIDGGDILAPDIHYTFDDTADPPDVEIINSYAGAPDGIYDLEFEYVPDASRNDPANGITNKVDVYVKGQRSRSVSEQAYFAQAVYFDAAGTYKPAEFERLDETAPSADNYFMPLHYCPILSVPDTLSNPFGADPAETLVEGTDYWIVHKKGAEGYAPGSVAGIEFLSTTNGSAKTFNSTEWITLTYEFNEVPHDVEIALNRWRLINSDTMVHQARTLLLDLHFAVILVPGANLATVESQMGATLSAFIDTVGFESVLQASDLLAVAHGVPGVDAIRFLTSSDDATYYAIQRVNINGAVQETYHSGGRATDVQTTDDSIPALNSVNITVVANNTFGTV